MKRLKFCVAALFFIGNCLGGAYADSDIRQTPVVRVVNEKSSSVVNISTERVVLLRYNPYWGHYGSIFDDFFKQYAGPTIGAMRLKGVGSGVVVSKDGLIVTNAHVINMTNKVYVILNDGTQYEAETVAIDQKSDLALIKIPAKQELKPVEIADDIIIGETVVAIGNPFGLENSVSAGIISGTKRKFVSGSNNQIIFDDLIQTDASINPGNSGGALLNLKGELVGINLAVIQNAQSVGFAISADRIKELTAKYRDYIKRNMIIKIPVQ